ncbi:MAG: Ldh family oxidoreductase [Acuticoccus sp.]
MSGSEPVRCDAAALERFVRAVLVALGADEATQDAATRAMMHGSRFGVDSHGVRLLPHYALVMKCGRVALRPTLRVLREGPATAVLDAGHAHGALAGYAATEKAVALARASGVGSVSIRNSSHFGAAGAFALAAAEAGMIGFATCNSDAFVRLHDGAERFHGTNPLAVAVPGGDRPWFFDMATSAIPYNRVLLYRSTATTLPDGTASDRGGVDTRDAGAADMLAPLGHAFGFKGAGLAGVAEIFSAVLSGMKLSAELLPMGGPDLTTPRGLGAFVMAFDPAAFVDRGPFEEGMARYVASLRGSRPRDGAEVLAPGDREWREAERRAREGIPLDPVTVAAFARLAEEHRVAPLATLPNDTNNH